MLSARLAEAGFTGALDVIESPLGFAIARNNVAGASLQDRLAVEQIMFKSHAACGGTHSAIDGLRELKKQRWFSWLPFGGVSGLPPSPGFRTLARLLRSLSA